jgi:hypothetical protein
MPHDDYLALIKHVDVQHDDSFESALSLWPGALKARGIPWWTVSQTDDADSFFRVDSLPGFNSKVGPHTQYWTNSAARYESGRMFFHLHIYGFGLRPGSLERHDVE